MSTSETWRDARLALCPRRTLEKSADVSRVHLSWRETDWEIEGEMRKCCGSEQRDEEE